MSITPPAADTARRPALETALNRLRSADDFPGVSGRIQQLMQVLGDEDASVQKLTNLIIQDYGITVKLLKTANTYHFNRSGVPFVSVSQAIVLMGVKAIRELASTIVLFEHFQRRSPGLRQLLMLSLLSANHAREIAAHTGGGRREEAYLLGMLRNLGEVLVACYLPEEYAAVLRDMAEHHCAERVSCRRVLQFEYQELAAEIAREWHMPSMSGVLAEPRAGERSDPDEPVVSFAHGLTSAVYRQGPDTSHQAVTLLLLKYNSLGLSREDVGSVLEAGIKGTKDTFAQAGIRLDDLQLKHQMAAALQDASDSISPSSSSDLRSPNAHADEASGPIAAVHAALDNRALDLNKLILIVLEATLTTGGFDRAMVALAAGARQEVSGRLALGQKSDALLSRFRYPLGLNGGPIGLAVSRGQELMLAGSWSLLPEELRLLRSLEAGTLLVLPLVVDKRAVGALYADTVGTSPLADAAVSTARQLRDAIIKAMRTRTPAL